MTQRARRALVTVVLLVAPAAACSGGDGASDDGASGIPVYEVDPDSTSPTDQAIAKAQADLRANPTDRRAQLALAQAFLQKARETADPVLYRGADRLLAELAENDPDDPRVLVAQGSLALSRHQFDRALGLGERALEAAPDNEAALGVTVDALNELGRYDEALDATQALADVRPGLAALARVSYARELRGDLDGAIEAMTQAVTAGRAVGGENLAYVQVLLANLLLTRGDVGQAERLYDDAEATFPRFPAAQAGRARVLVAQERYDEAADLLAPVVEGQPLIEYVVAHGDALTAAGRDDEAADSYALVDGIARLLKANGVIVDIDLALFDAQQDPGPAAVRRARRALEVRPSIVGHDALAWSLFRADDVDGAVTEIEAALETGSQDPLIRYHAAEISAAIGDRDAAIEHLEIVLATNPRVAAIHVDDVENLADELGLQMPPPAVG